MLLASQLIPVVTANIWLKCQNKCPYCVAYVANQLSDPFRDGRDPEQVLDVNAVLAWINKYRPNARIHISGGEPLLYEGIEDWVCACLYAKRKITILTNGQLVPLRKQLHNKPINWIVTYHKDCGVGLNDYCQGLAGLQGKNVEVRTIIETAGDSLAYTKELTTIFKGFDFRIRYDRQESRTAELWKIPKIVDVYNVASSLLTLVENDGKVYACNGKADGAIGDVYSMQYDATRAKVKDLQAVNCSKEQICGAFNTLVWEQYKEAVGVWK